MGWFPARDRNNLVPLENLYYNQPDAQRRAREGGERTIKIKRGSSASCGTRKHPHACDRNPKNGSPTKKDRPYKLLAANALKFGYVNGVKIGGKKHAPKAQA